MNYRSLAEFFVAGEAVTQGSKRAFVPKRKDGSHGRPLVLDDNRAELRQWRTMIGVVARQHVKNVTAEAIALDVVFLLRKPPSRPKRDKLPMNERSGDVDKLLRAVMDALTAVVYGTDAVVVDAHVKKRWAPSGQQPGVYVWIKEVIP